MTGVLDLAPGAAIVLDGTEWTVERVEPHCGRVVLRNTCGKRLPVTMRFLMDHPGCRSSTRTASRRPAAAGRQAPGLADLTERQREIVSIRAAHLLEADLDTTKPTNSAQPR
ncbi:hypothetical protein [Amycolatopsis sp. cg13]|uniref:hypothetical protein n=1 Tax=Amycolatopsis sp. cg13 TaxID=3238807 RepID=UPI003525FFAA